MFFKEAVLCRFMSSDSDLRKKHVEIAQHSRLSEMGVVIIHGRRSGRSRKVEWTRKSLTGVSEETMKELSTEGSRDNP